MQDERKQVTITPYSYSTQLGKILGSNNIIHLLFQISEQPMRYTEITNATDIPKTTLTTHLNSLVDYHILDKQQTTIKGRKTHLYSVTKIGMDILKFFERFERITSIDITQQKLVETTN